MGWIGGVARKGVVLVGTVAASLLLTGCHRDYIIGDFVWLDVDRDGIQDEGEPGVGGVTVRACSYSSSQDFRCRETTTASDGGYRIGLPVNAVFDTYVEITFEPPPGYLFTPSNQGGDDTVDSDGRSTTLGPYRHNDLPPDDNTIDAGVIRPDVSVGDLVWDDLDRDGIQDPGEPGVAGVPVALVADPDTVIATAVSDADGLYTLGPVPAGPYRVRFGLPAGRQLTAQNQGGNDFLDSDADPATGETAVISFADGVYTSIDAGLVAEGPVPVLGQLGDFVWRDIDRDGIQDAGEPGVAGIVVELRDSDGLTIDEVVTDAAGFYSFTGVRAGSYQVRFAGGDGLLFTPQDQGGDDTVDSDAGPGGLTRLIVLDAGQIETTVDAGLVAPG